MGRFQELGLPASLIDMDEFRDHFLHHRWVMFVRDRDNIADVHLVQPNQQTEARASNKPR